MDIQRYGFIVVGEPFVFRFEGERFTATIIGVRSPRDAGPAVKTLLDAGVELIEVCGAFGVDGAATVRSQIDGRALFGAVVDSADAARAMLGALEQQP